MLGREVLWMNGQGAGWGIQILVIGYEVTQLHMSIEGTSTK